MNAWGFPGGEKGQERPGEREYRTGRKKYTREGFETADTKLGFESLHQNQHVVQNDSVAVSNAGQRGYNLGNSQQFCQILKQL